MPLARRDEDRLKRLTRQIRLGERAEQERGQVLVQLQESGISYDALAAACGVSREMIRKAILRRTTGYPGT